MFKLVLLTSRVTAEQSFAPGDEIEVENDEAWRMVSAGLAEVVGEDKPVKPEAIVAAEKEAAAAANEKKAAAKLKSVHPEGKELAELKARADKERAASKKKMKQLEAQVDELSIEVERLKKIETAYEALQSDQSEDDQE